MTALPTLLGHVTSVKGINIQAYLTRDVASGLAFIEGAAYRVGQVGSFVRIPQGYADQFGVISEIGASVAPSNAEGTTTETGRWLRVQLVGEAVGAHFERGVSQHPNVGDPIHLVTESDLERIYRVGDGGRVTLGRLSSVESIEVGVDLDLLVARHSAVLGSTGSGKSTTVASLLRSIAAGKVGGTALPSARVLLLDLHGEYGDALKDVSRVLRVQGGKDAASDALAIPFWALDAKEVLDITMPGLSEARLTSVLDRVAQLKAKTIAKHAIEGVSEANLTADTPVPFSLHQLWFELIEPEVRTYSDSQRTVPAKLANGNGNANTLTAPSYSPATSTNSAPYINQGAWGIKRPLDAMRARLLDHKYDFLLHPGDWEPDLEGVCKQGLEALLEQWLGHDRAITVLDLSGVPSDVLTTLVATILKIVYEAMFWSRNLPEGTRQRPLLIVMEEAHRYLMAKKDQLPGSALALTQRIVKEGRKYGIGAMIVSQRPTEIDSTVLSQCGTYFAMRLSNASDQSAVQGTVPESLAGLMDMLPVLRTGEIIITGEATPMPTRCRVTLPASEHRPRSADPKVTEQWTKPRAKGEYAKVAAAWRAKDAGSAK